MKYTRVIRSVFNTPWAIVPDKLDAIADLIDRRIAASAAAEEVVNAQEEITAANGERSKARSTGAIAVLPVFGVIAHRMNLMTQFSGGTSTEAFTAQFRAAMADPNISTVVLDIDSPGGTVHGVPELTEEIFRARGKKKIVAVANPLAASGAFWIGSAADQLVVIPSGMVGSVGVEALHTDFSQREEKEGIKRTAISSRVSPAKNLARDGEPLSDEALADVQSKVDFFADMFVRDLARNRSVSQKTVRDNFGQGRVLLAPDALKAGMVDRIATLDQTIARLAGMKAEEGPLKLECGCLDMCAGHEPEPPPTVSHEVLAAKAKAELELRARRMTFSLRCEKENTNAEHQSSASA